jgi:DNA-binding CsgD family transcriptional regulator
MSRPPPEIAAHRARLRRTSRGAAAPAATFTAAEVRALLRLGNELRDSAEPAARKTRLLEGLGRLLGADAGVCVVTNTAAPPGPAGVVTVDRWAISADEADAIAARLPAAAAHGNSVPALLPSSEATDRIESGVPVAGGKLRAWVALLRRPPGRRPFSRHDLSVLDLFHSELDWLYRLDLPLVSPAGLALTPRQRQTLQFLLAGHSEKQIATRLGLSPNTVHHYVKAIHRHLRVSSRSELLARWVGK